MSPLKFSLFGSGDDDRKDEVELDDDALVGQLREVVDQTPDLTMEGALREGIQHVVERHGKSSGS
jgi:hypothetical protein